MFKQITRLLLPIFLSGVVAVGAFAVQQSRFPQIAQAYTSRQCPAFDANHCYSVSAPSANNTIVGMQVTFIDNGFTMDTNTSHMNNVLWVCIGTDYSAFCPSDDTILEVGYKGQIISGPTVYFSQYVSINGSQVWASPLTTSPDGQSHVYRIFAWNHTDDWVITIDGVSVYDHTYTGITSTHTSEVEGGGELSYTGAGSMNSSQTTVNDFLNTYASLTTWGGAWTARNVSSQYVDFPCPTYTVDCFTGTASTNTWSWSKIA